MMAHLIYISVVLPERIVVILGPDTQIKFCLRTSRTKNGPSNIHRCIRSSTT
jgi:hypothetical protein